MPTYAYRCQQCGEIFEQSEPISEHGQIKPQLTGPRKRPPAKAGDHAA
jgi:predicted nucleic acid-binding Zn ribbon protein